MSTLSGNTIASSYPSLIKIQSFSGATTTYDRVTDGLGNTLPLEIATDKIKFYDRVDFKDTTTLDFSGTSSSFKDATITLSGTNMDFRPANVQGLVKNVAVQKDTGRLTGLTDTISYSGGTGINIEQDNITGIFTFSVLPDASTANIIKIGTGTTTTQGKAVYWNGTEWQQNPTSSNAYDKLIGISVGTNTLTDGVYINGLITLGAQTGYTAGSLYLSTSSFSNTPDYTEGNAQRGIGHSLGSLGIVLNPDIYYIINDANTSYIITNNDEVLITNDGFALSYE